MHMNQLQQIALNLTALLLSAEVLLPKCKVRLAA
jgi:hypothetical protein